MKSFIVLLLSFSSMSWANPNGGQLNLRSTSINPQTTIHYSDSNSGSYYTYQLELVDAGYACKLSEKWSKSGSHNQQTAQLNQLDRRCASLSYAPGGCSKTTIETIEDSSISGSYTTNEIIIDNDCLCKRVYSHSKSGRRVSMTDVLPDSYCP